MGAFRDFVLAISPPWARGHYGERFVGFAMGAMSDLMAEGAGQALKAPWLHSDTSPPDALPLLGDERSMPRYYADTDTTYRDRLHGAWDAWAFAGNEDGDGDSGIIGQYTAMGIEHVVIVPAENADARVERPSWRFELVPTVIATGLMLTFAKDDGSSNSLITAAGAAAGLFSDIGFTAGRKLCIIGSTDNDGCYEILTLLSAGAAIRLNGKVLNNEVAPAGTWLDGTEWSRFAVVIEPPNWSAASAYGSGMLYDDSDAGPTYGSSANNGDVRAAKAIARKWSPGHAINPYIYVILSGEYYGDPSSVYGAAGLVYGGTAIAWPNQV